MPYKMAHYTEHRPPAALDGLSCYPWYGTDYLNSLTPKFPLGAMWEMTGNEHEAGGNVFMAVRAENALAIGDIVGNVKPIAYACKATGVAEKLANSTAVTQSVRSSNFTSFSAAVALNCPPRVGELIQVSTTGATLRYLRTIKAIDTDGTDYRVYWALRDFTNYSSVQAATAAPTIVSDPDVLPAAPTTSTDYLTWLRQWTVTPNDTASGTPNVVGSTAVAYPYGISLAAVTAGYYTVIQVAGICLVKCTGSGTAVALGSALTAEANVAIGMTNALAGSPTVTTAVFPRQPYTIQAMEANAGSVLPIACKVNFLACI